MERAGERILAPAQAVKLIHVLAGLTALLAGALALYALKGARLHRRSGIVFVYAMLVMSSTGALMSILHLNVGNVMAGVLTFYLVLTALLAVRRPSLEFHAIDKAGLLAALTVGLTAVTLGAVAAGSATGKMHGLPPPVYFMFGTVALLSAFGDLRVMRGWVEQGDAPNEVIASRVERGKVVRTRPLCPYPQGAAYRGRGSTDEASNFVCR